MRLFYFLIPFLVIGIVNYCIDYGFYLYDRYCRFHIGRWSRNEWEAAVERCARRWLKKTPVVKITDNSRYILLDIINGKYRSRAIQSWQKAALILGLLEKGEKKNTKKFQADIDNMFLSQGMWKEKPTNVDFGMLSCALLRTCEDSSAIKGAMDEVAMLLKNNVNQYGMISYTGGKDNPDMYVDTIGLTCPFLALYSKVYGDTESEDIAFRQIEMFRRYGVLEESGLPNHAFHIVSKLPLGVYGWGRGTGWWVIGLLESYSSIRNMEYRRQLEKWIREAAERYAVFQRPDGGFGSILQDEKSYDSSATAVMAWFYASCCELFSNEGYRIVAEKCLGKLLKCTRITGAIDWCQGDTKGIGVFSQTYDIMPFAQGYALRAIYILKNNSQELRV